MSMFIAEAGHYLLLPLLTLTSESCADFRSPYINVSEACLQFKYTPLYEDVHWIMEIYMQNEELDVVSIKTLQYSEINATVAIVDWQLLFIKLPKSTGLQQIIVKITRRAGVFTGFAVDDFTIRPCSDFSKLIVLYEKKNICIDFH